jgi:Tfp pilus assembly protein PilF
VRVTISETSLNKPDGRAMTRTLDSNRKEGVAMNTSFCRFSNLLAFYFLLQMILVGCATAQNPNPVIRGIVKDGADQPIKGASVLAFQLDGYFTCSTTTDSMGKFLFFLGRANAGTYIVGVRKTGFKPGYQNIKANINEMPPNLIFALTPGKDEKLWFEISVSAIHLKPLRMQGDKVKLEGKAKKLFDNGVSAYNEVKYDKAIKGLTEALKLAPREPLIWFDLGLAYERKELYKEALAAIEKAINYDDTNNHELLVHKAEMLYRLDKFDEAEQTIKKVSGIAENMSKADAARCYLSIGIMMQNLYDYDRAIEYYKRAILIDQQFAMAHYRLGRILMRNANTVCQAIEELNIFIGIGEANPEDKKTVKELLEEFKDTTCPK